jgi:hypothetical protein
VSGEDGDPARGLQLRVAMTFYARDQEHATKINLLSLRAGIPEGKPHALNARFGRVTRLV